MLVNSLSDFGVDVDWADRGNYWAANQPKPRIWSNQRRNLRAPLVLTGHGISLRVNQGALEVRDGFTHYPQQREEWRFFRGEERRPSRILMVDADGRITLDVLAWLSEQEIPLIQLDYRGRAVTAIGASSAGSADPRVAPAQRAAAAKPKRQMAIASWFISEKLHRSAAVLRELIPPSAARAAAISQLEEAAVKLRKKPPMTIPDLLGIEGTGARLYFGCWHGLPLEWKGTAQHPIPPEWHQIGPRSSARKRNSNRHATHPLNAMLNYSYTALEGQLRVALIGAGLDLSIGFLHSSPKHENAFLLDMLEPCRVAADELVLKLALSGKLQARDFAITAAGVVRLHPQLARWLVSSFALQHDTGRLLAECARVIGL